MAPFSCAIVVTAANYIFIFEQSSCIALQILLVTLLGLSKLHEGLGPGGDSCYLAASLLLSSCLSGLVAIFSIVKEERSSELRKTILRDR